MEALIIQTGTPPGPDGIALWLTMKNSICQQTSFLASGHITDFQRARYYG
jgi:hypothetical protein